MPAKHKKFVESFIKKTDLEKKQFYKEKKYRWRNWAIKIHKLLKPSAMILGQDTCAYQSMHIVESVERFGGGYKIKSKACNGCSLGKYFNDLKGETPCVFLSSPFFTYISVKRGDVVNLRKV